MNEKKPYLVVILIQSIYAAYFLLSKAAFDKGMNNFVFVFYRQAIGTIFLAPFAFYFEWKNAPPLSFTTFCKIFMLSLCGITLSLNIYGVGLVYTNASLAAAISNSLPVVTFFLALLLRKEVMKLKTKPGVAKLVGILGCMAGVLTLALYKGPNLRLIPSHHHHISDHLKAHVASTKTWIWGCFLLLSSNFFWSLWLVLQNGVMKSYPSKLMFTTLQCLLSTIQSFMIAIAMERDLSQWKLGWNVRLLSVVYCGVVVTGVTYYLQAWVIDKKGPVFLSMSQPFVLIFTLFCSSFILGDIVTLGSILGGVCLVGGLYSVLWGKNLEQKVNDKCCLPVDVHKPCTEIKEIPAPTPAPATEKTPPIALSV